MGSSNLFQLRDFWLLVKIRHLFFLSKRVDRFQRLLQFDEITLQWINQFIFAGSIRIDDLSGGYCYPILKHLPPEVLVTCLQGRTFHGSRLFCWSKNPTKIFWGPQTKSHQNSLQLCFLGLADYVVLFNWTDPPSLTSVISVNFFSKHVNLSIRHIKVLIFTCNIRENITFVNLSLICQWDFWKLIKLPDLLQLRHLYRIHYSLYNKVESSKVWYCFVNIFLCVAPESREID